MTDPTTPPTLLAQLDRRTLTALWSKLDMDPIFGDPKGRPSTSLANDFDLRFGHQILSVKPIRDALLRHFADIYGVRQLRSDRGVNKNRKDWPSDLFQRWHAGGAWSRRLCRALGLDEAYAGLPGLETAPRVETLEPRVELHPLLDFQQDLADQIVKCVRSGDDARGMASMPTGAGKTRTAMDAIFRLQAELGGVILWIALSQEICEQAARAYKQVYLSARYDFVGRIHRLWGQNQIDPDFDEGFVVASAQKLNALLDGPRAKRQALKNLADATTLVVFDEAHHVIAPSYRRVLNYFSRRKDRAPVPVIGLTATPGRGSDPTREQVRRLATFFDGNLLVPSILSRSTNPYSRLQREGILSKTRDEQLETDEAIEVTADEKRHLEDFHAYPPKLLRRIGLNAERNQKILRAVTRRHAQKPRPTLVFACDTTQAELLATEWRRRGLNARVILGETPTALRQEWIEDFKRGQVDILVNFGVLTTGFDAPNVGRVVMARPTTSPVLFEQMIGRGLRGPRFGGTDECQVLDIVDRFQFHGPPKGFARWELEWMKGRR